MANTRVRFSNRAVEHIIKDIREEAGTQKECITRYTFQTLAISGALWAFAFKFDSDNHGLFFAACGMICCTFVVCIVLHVARMANHKYHTINRNLGYELHLYRLKDYFLKREHAKDWSAEKWSEMMLDIGWEEAMCAARVVQATLFNYLYTDKCLTLPKGFPYLGWFNLHWLRTYRVKREHKAESYSQKQLNGKAIYSWYDTNKLINSDDDYHPGNYLRNVHVILFGVGFLSIGLIWGFYLWACHKGQPDPRHILSLDHLLSIKGLYFALFGLGNFAFTVLFIAQARRQRSFRRILQSGLLSIQSSAVVWRIVCTCHIFGNKCAFYKNDSYMSYTRYTHRIALEAAKNFYRIHAWLSELEECFEDEKIRHRKLDELLPASKEPQYLEYLPGQEPNSKLDKWP